MDEDNELEILQPTYIERPIKYSKSDDGIQAWARRIKINTLQCNRIQGAESLMNKPTTDEIKWKNKRTHQSIRYKMNAENKNKYYEKLPKQK